MEELQIVINQELGTITTNFDTLKLAVIAKTEEYKKLEVTEENKSKIKKRIAELRGDIKIINEHRVSVKKICLEPYFAFEDKTTDVIGVYNDAISVLDSQVKRIEDIQRLQKQADIKSAYTELIGDLADNLSLESIYDTRWENATASMKSVKDEIGVKIANTRQAVVTIKGMASDKSDEALEQYWVDLDLSTAIQTITRYEQQKKEIQARLEAQQKAEKEREFEAEKERIRNEEREKIRAEEEERKKALQREEQIREEERQKAQAEQEAKELEERKAMEIHKAETANSASVRTYAIEATPEEFEQIEMYMNSLGVEFQSL